MRTTSANGAAARIGASRGVPASLLAADSARQPQAATVAAMKRGANHVYRYEDLKVPEFRDLIRSLVDRFKEIQVT